MSKKKLSDLLRAEVQKEAEVAVEAVEAVEAVAVEAAVEQDARGQGAEGGEGITPPKPLGRMTKAELLEFVKVLQGLLLEERERAGRLEGQQRQHQEVLEGLKIKVEQGQGVRDELEGARADALGLAQENKRLKAQLVQLQKDDEGLVQGREQLSQDTTGGTTGGMQRRGQMVRRTPVPRPPSRSILERPIRPSPVAKKSARKPKSFDTWCYD